MPHRLVFTGKQQVACESFSLPELKAGQVLTRTICSLMSTGTENIVFNRLFAPGTHWDNWAKYPFYPGYSSVAEVVEVGPEVTSLTVGDRLALRGKHASHQIVDAADAAVVPAGLDPQQIAWHALAKIAFIGARAAQYRLGDTVLIIGAGPIGQMSLRWAVANGAAQVAVVDPMAGRLTLATRGGASAVFSCPLTELAEPLKAALGGELPRVVVDTTGANPVFAQALGLARARGRVVLLGDTGTPGEQHLTGDLLLKGLSVVGAHDCHNDDGWNSTTVARFFCQLVCSGRFNLDGLVSHVFDPRRCAEVYAEVNAKRGETMGVVFDWRACA